MERLLKDADSQGVRVFFLPLDEVNGFVNADRAVVINSRLSERKQRVVLAHELGHLYHGHDWRLAHDQERDERQADIYAALILIDPVEYALAERIYDGCLGSIANELGVTRRLVELWRTSRAKDQDRLLKYLQ